MTKNKLDKFKLIGLSLALPVCALGIGLLSFPKATTSADEYISGHIENVSVNNGSFTSGGGEYSSGYSLSGWEAEDRSSEAAGMLINVGANFNDYRSEYMLNNNPHKTGADDNRILMINSRTDANAANKFLRQGYSLANNITLEANSYYRVAVDALTSLDGQGNGAYSAYASIYIELEGLKDDNGQNVKICYEGIDNTTWETYYFFIATGNETQSLNISLYLGSKTTDSTGVVFFDEVTLTRFAENTFYSFAKDEGYNFVDVYTGDRDNTRFVVDAFKDDDTVVDTSALNFDFDDAIDDSSSLGSKWKSVTSTSTSHAWIMPVYNGVQQEYFSQQTKSSYHPNGYAFVGNDLSYNSRTGKENQNALVLYNDAPSYVTVESQSIDIPAHAIYKISLRAKISELISGNFTVGIAENDSVISKYNITYTPSEFSKNGSTNNPSNPFYNNYTTVELYVKGHDLYNSSFNIRLSLGTSEAPAEGCVVLDNIVVSHVDYNTYENASSNDKTELTLGASDATFTNGYFNKTQNQSAGLVYPLDAQGFTASKGEGATGGVIYLSDEETYDSIYKPVYEGDKLVSGYEWYTAHPGHPNGNTYSPNNVYMMYNEKDTYQSLTTPVFTAGEGITEISFDLKTLSQVIVEISDENGILLLHREGISSSSWQKFRFFVQGGESVSSNLTLTIHLGQQKSGNRTEKLASGYAFIDNFNTRSNVTLSPSIPVDVDLSDYYLNLDPYGDLGDGLNEFTSSSAYKFDSENYHPHVAGTIAQGGLIKGTGNTFDVTSENGNNILTISLFSASKASITSKYNFTLSSDSYYKLTFDLQTSFNYDKDEFDKDKHSCKSGVSVGLSDFNKAENLRSDGKFTSYTIYFKTSSSEATPNLVFTVDSDCDESLGSAYLTNIKFASATKDDYAAASENPSYGATIFTSSASQSDNTGDNTEQTPSATANHEELWVIIPSLIMALSVIAAIVAFALRKVKIKKTERMHPESYDRKAQVNHDIILKRAQEERDREAQELRTTLEALAQERADLENEHKEAIRASRSSGGKVTKATEREFKSYAARIARLGEKEEILREQLDTTLSADYLITIEKRLAAEEERELREMAKLKPAKDEKADGDENK